MRTVFKIAKAEFRTLYYSPILWLLSIVFLVLCGLSWFRIMMVETGLQDLHINLYGAKNYFAGDGAYSSLTYSLLGMEKAHHNGFIDIAIQNMFLFIPVLTMGVISREMNNGTFKLLYSSPVRFRQIVLGKYIALAFYNLLLLGVMAVFFLLTVLYTNGADTGMMFSLSLGFYLLICTYAAIGLFMSTLTSYQIVSALGTFLVLAFLDQVGNFGQRIDFVRDLTWFLSLKSRAERMFDGLIVSRDVIYFLTVTSLFLCFAVLKMKGAQQFGNKLLQSGRYLAVLVLALMIGYISSRPALTAYWDATASQRNTIPAEFQQLLKDFGKEPVEVTLYTNLLESGAGMGLPENRNNYLAALWDPFIRFKPDLNFKYEYYYNNNPAADDSALLKSYGNRSIDEIAGIKAKEVFDIDLSTFKKPSEIDRELNLKEENYRLVMRLRYKDRTVFLRTSENGLWPEWNNTIGAFKNLLSGHTPKLYYLTGNWERSIFKKGEREYSQHSADKGNLSALINLGFSIDTLSLDHQEIPGDAELIVLADPKSTLSNTVLSKLRQFIDGGGNMFILAEPGKQEILQPLLHSIKIDLKPGQWVADNLFETADQILTEAVNLKTLLGENYNKQNWDRLTKRPPDILMTGLAIPCVMDSTPFKTTQLLTRFIPGWHKKDYWIPDSIPPVFNPKAGDTKEGFESLLALTRMVKNKEQRVLVSGDADFMSNLRLPSTKWQPTYISALYSWLTYFTYPIQVKKGNEAKNNFLDDINSEKAELLKIIFVWIVPVLLIIFGSIFLMRRKRK